MSNVINLSEYKQPSKPVFVVDLDEVVYPFVDTFRQFANERHDVVSFEAESWNFWADWGWTSEQFTQNLSDFSSLGGFTSAPPLPNAQLGLQCMDEFFHLVAVTTRPESARIDSTNWVRDWELPIHNVILSADKPAVCQVLEAIGIVDDGIHNLHGLPDDCAGFLWDQLHNRDVLVPSDVFRVTKWTEMIWQVTGDPGTGSKRLGSAV